MAPPNYFFPGVTVGQLVKNDKLAREILRPRKLDVVFADINSVTRDCTAFDLAGAGPDGKGGCLLCAHRADGQKPPRVGIYKPEHQDWTEFHEGETSYYVGLDKHLPTGPEDLVRKGPNPFDRGYWVELAGAKWYVPVIRDCEDGTGLPQDWGLDESGLVETTMQASYRELWNEFAAVVDLLFTPDCQDSPDTISIDPAEAMRRCLQGLGLRYRIGRALLNLLRLINSQSYFSVLGAMVDLPTFWDVWRENQSEQAKKNSPSPGPAPGPESPDTAPGPRAEPPITGLAEPI